MNKNDLGYFYSDYVPLSTLSGFKLRLENRRVKIVETGEIKTVSIVYIFEKWGMLIEDVELIWFYKPKEVEVLPIDGTENSNDIKPLSEELINFTNKYSSDNKSTTDREQYERESEEIKRKRLEDDVREDIDSVIEELKNKCLNIKSGKKFKIKQYRPAYFSGFDNDEVEFDTVDELLGIKFVKGFSTDPDFFQYSLCFHEPVENIKLMAEYKNGTEWWVVGFISTKNNYEDVINMLPKWEPKEKGVDK